MQKPNEMEEQVRMWKERNAQMETLLAKKNGRLQEMEETVRWLQRWGGAWR